MRLARALELTHTIASTPGSIEGLDSLLDPSWGGQALEQAGVATLRKRAFAAVNDVLVRYFHGVLSPHVGLGCGQSHGHHVAGPASIAGAQRRGPSPPAIG